MNSPAKGPKKNCDKSAVAILKNTRQLDCVFSGYGAAEVFIDFADELKHTEANRMCSIHQIKAVLRHANFRDQKPSLGIFFPGDPHQRNPILQNLRIGLEKRQKGKSDMPVKQRGKWQDVSEIKGET